MGLGAAEAKGREHILSDMRADSVLAAQDTNVTAVSQVTASPLLPRASPLPLLWDGRKICSSPGCTAMDAAKVFVTAN